MNFDQFQRHFQQRMSTGAGKGMGDKITYKPVIYPCMSPRGEARIGPKNSIRVSESLDLFIEDVFPVSLKNNASNTYTNGAVVVSPSPTPIHLRIEEDGNKTVRYVFPIRKPGKTDLEDDWERIQEYIHKHFRSSLVDEIVGELAKHFIKPAADQVAYISENEICERAEKYASKWQSLGYPYHLIEEFGKSIKSHMNNTGLWEKETRPEVLAFLLTVSLHYNAGWEKWTPRNSANKIAISALFEAFHTNYWRSRFRAFYALQFMDQSQIKAELEKEKHLQLSAKTREILQTSVPGRTVISFIKNIAEGSNDDIARKAKAVLTEIATLWNDPDVGTEVPL